jgi:hypothetical protein|nr:MAG TPA: Cas system-associated protein [Bacteriophage sp.]
MEKFISPRGSGRTTQICKYAIENDCDIIVPTINQFDHIVNTIQKICSSSDGEWIYCGIDKPAATVNVAVWNGQRQIKIYDARSFVVYFGNSKKTVVIDDIDECMKYVVRHRMIAACSMATYDPAEVAFTRDFHPAAFRSLL